MPWPTVPYVRDLALSTKPMTGKRDLPHDLAVRTGTFVRGTRVIYSRVELGAAPSGQLLRIWIHRPDLKLAQQAWTTLPTSHGGAYWRFAHRLSLSTVGRWRIVVELGGRVLADTRFDVVATKAEIRNRPPRRMNVELVPSTPSPATAVECRVATTLSAEDPDFEIVRYRYRWTVDGKLVRAVQSAALSDVLRKGAATSGKDVRCTVTPSDGRLSGPTATTASR